MPQRSLTILGSTGSIGTQALSLVRIHPERFRIAALSAHNNAELLFEQVRAFRPKMAGLTGGEVEIPEDLRFCDWSFGTDALKHLAGYAPADDVLVSVVGMVGLESVLAALQAGRRVLLANKEALVAGGELDMRHATHGDHPNLLPVDSEHSAVFQCLENARGNAYDHITLTASGGPFRTWSAQDIAHATPQQALRHPNWAMGRKVTVDSATLFNKALEVIEARWLFSAQPAQIRVLIHPQSIIHSMVTFRDGAVLAQLGTPDMKVPILYAMVYPDRLPTGGAPLDLAALGSLTFEAPDPVRFPALRLVKEALSQCGAACCVLNAANEVAVHAFLNETLPFGAIAQVVEETLSHVGHLPADTLDHVLDADRLARQHAQALCAARG
ncbi:MAG: 1-deoxy-D-xylulose-5-phosphate reductoisomerase [Clostridiales bacterium]|nr:1-deoxy-D-xylulose-5-phosphate reductoisomerase [Clostridiales bacterium]